MLDLCSPKWMYLEWVGVFNSSPKWSLGLFEVHRELGGDPTDNAIKPRFSRSSIHSKKSKSAIRRFLGQNLAYFLGSIDLIDKIECID